MMGTSSQFNDDVQLNIYAHLAQTSTIEQGSKETFVQAWSSLLNNNVNLNIQFN